MFKLIAGMTAPFVGFVIAMNSIKAISASILAVPETGALAGTSEEFYGAVLSLLLGGGLLGAGLVLLVWSWREITRG